MWKNGENAMTEGFEFSSKVTQAKSNKKKKGSMVNEKTWTVSITVKNIPTRTEADEIESQLEDTVTEQGGQETL